ncbi:MAG: helix-turn-helix domain-containing protein [Haloarculaceae archaeon]
MRKAVIEIPHEAFADVGLAAFVSLYREAGLRNLSELVCQSPGCIVVMEVDSRVRESVLDDLDYVDWWERLHETEDEVVYLTKLVVSEALCAIDGDATTVTSEEVQVSADGLAISLVGAQDDIAKNVAAYEDAGVGVALHRLGDYEGPSDPLDALTECQRDVVETAYDLGYYDVPRTVSTDDVATELDLDRSTVTEHLQRAERNLLGAVLDGT